MLMPVDLDDGISPAFPGFGGRHNEVWLRGCARKVSRCWLGHRSVGVGGELSGFSPSLDVRRRCRTGAPLDR